LGKQRQIIFSDPAHRSGPVASLCRAGE